MNGPDIDRRTFIRGAGATVGAGAVGVGSQSFGRGPVQPASAVLPLVPIGIAVGAGALGYLINEGVDYLTGDDKDYSGYTGISALRSDILAGTLEMQSADERVMTSIENNIESSDNVGLAKGKATLLKAMNAGDDVATAKTKMNDTLDSYYSILQNNLLEHFKAQRAQAAHQYDQIVAHGSGDGTNFEFYYEGTGWYGMASDLFIGNQIGASGNFNTEQATFTLYDGTSKTYNVSYVYNSTNTTPDGIVALTPDHIPVDRNYPSEFRFTNVDTAESQTYMPVQRYWDAWNAIGAARDRVNANLQGFADDVYNTYTPGEIPTEDLVDPITAYTELNQDYNDTGYYGFQAASAAMLGIPTSRGLEMLMYLESSESEVEAQLYTNHQPTDGQGNEIPYRAGQTYDPTTWADPAYIAYKGIFEDSDGNIVEEDDFVQVEQPFTIREMTDKDGTQIDESDLEPDNYQTYDVAALEAELKQIREAQIAMQEESQDDDGSPAGAGGGGFFEDMGRDSLAILGIIAVGAYGVLSNN